MGIIDTLRQALNRKPQLEPVFGDMNEANTALINDGISYTQPVVVHSWQRREMEPKALQEHIMESARSYYHHQFDTPYNKNLPFTPVTEDPLSEWNHATRMRVLSTCHEVYQRNPIANAGVQYTADFVIGDTGFNLTTKNKEVETILNEFIDNPDNAIRQYERQAMVDLQVDGEIMLQVHRGEGDAGGQVVVAPMRPWECEWIKTEKGFFRRKEIFYFQADQREGDSPEGEQDTELIEVPADDMLHIAINNHSYELRGRPELYRILAWLRADKEFLENRARQNVWRNALLWLIQIANASASTIASIRSKWTKPPAPGSNFVTSDKVQVTPLSNPVGANDAAEDGRQIKLRAIAGFRMAEYMFGDGENANLATATAQQLPALTKFNAFQTMLIQQLWKPLFKLVLQEAIDAQLLPEEVDEQDIDGDPVRDEPEQEAPDLFRPQQPQTNGANGEQEDDQQPQEQPQPKRRGKVRRLKTLDAFDVSYEPISKEAPNTLAQALTLALQNELVSVETASAEMGFNFQQEQKRMKQERLRKMGEMASGERMPPPMFMRPEGLDGNGKTGDNKDEQEREPKEA